MSRKGVKDKPWITTGLKESIKRKHLLYQKFIFDSSEENKVAHKIFKNKLRTVIRKAEYYKNVFSSKTQSMKEMWKELGKLLNKKKKNKGSSISKIIINTKIITDDKAIANELNDHFTKIGKNLADKVKTERNHLFKNYLTNPIHESLFLRPIDNNEVLNPNQYGGGGALWPPYSFSSISLERNFLTFSFYLLAVRKI